MSRENPYTRNYFHSVSSESNEPPKRLVNAPTLYCIFASGVILVAVGTFITAHCYVGVPEEEQQTPVKEGLKYIGPILLGCGGLFLVGISILCIVVCKTNKRRNSLSSEPIFNVGPSTFYSPRPSKNESFFDDDLGVDNMSGPQDDDDPMKFLAKTVVAERRRKLSRKISPLSEANTDAFSNEPEVSIHNALVHQYGRNEMGPLQAGKYHHSTSMTENAEAEENLKRTQGFETLLQDSGLFQSSDSISQGTTSRSRSQSMAGPRPKVFISRNEPLRRNATVTTENGKFHRSELRNKELHRQLVEKQMNQTLKKKKNATGQTDHPQVHNLSSYSPEVVESLIGMADKINFERSSSYQSGEAMLNSAPKFNSASRLDHLSKLKDGNLYSTTMTPNSFFNGLESPENTQENVQLSFQNGNYHQGSLDAKVWKQKDNEAEYLPHTDKVPKKMNMGVSSLVRSREGMIQEPENIVCKASWESSDSSSSAQIRVSSEPSKKGSRESRVKRKKTRKQLRDQSTIKNSLTKRKQIAEPNEEKKKKKNLDHNNSSDSDVDKLSNCSCSSCANCEDKPPTAAKALTAASDIMDDLRENSDSGVVTTLRKNSVIQSQRNKALSVIRSSGHGSVVSSDDENDLDNVIDV